MTYITRRQRQALRRKRRKFIVGILLLFLLSGYLLNKKYVEPIVGDLQQLRNNPNQKPSSNLQELHEIYTAWQNSNYQNKEKLLSLEQEKSLAQQEYERAVHNLQSIAR